ncbi:putative zinc-binding protein [Zoogloea sp.]|uniref:putative zinc-binding protein n=1 Tax=Zoogloea sp. TaxID=49181 RepID=UPI0035B39BFA
MANYVAVELDRAEMAEMSCIAGVGGNVPHLVRIARSGRPILALDGCPLQCVKSSLAQRGLAPTRHILLHEHGIKKRYRTQFDMDDAKRLLKATMEVARDLAQGPAPDPAEAVAPGSPRDEGAPPMKPALRLRPPQH